MAIRRAAMARATTHNQRNSRSSQRGQAMVFTLAFAVVLCLAVLLLFNNSKLANAKTSLQNAADAAALAAATLQARDHNFTAYTNRAMIANQVAVAQLVSLNSYLNDAETTQKRMVSTLHKLYASLPTSKPAWTLAQSAVVRNTQTTLNKIPPVLVMPLDRLISALQIAQELHHQGTKLEMLLVAHEVAQHNDPQVRVSTSLFMAGNAIRQVAAWSNANHKHSASNNTQEADRFAKVVLHQDSMDGFTANRAGLLSAGWLNSRVSQTRCPLAVKSNTTFGFVHMGGTQLSADKKKWLALDATSGLGFVSCTWIHPWILPPFVKQTTVTLPLPDISTSPWGYGGSAGAMAGKGNSYPDLGGHKANANTSYAYGGAAFMPTGGIQRYREGPGKTLDTQGGLQDYYRDVTDPLNKKPENQTPAQNGGATPITIEVERPIKGLRLSNELMPAGSKDAKDAQSLRLDDAAAGAVLRTVASAHAYFYRPARNSSEFTGKNWQRADKKTELANLFSPYWQARLTETSAAERAASAVGQAL